MSLTIFANDEPAEPPRKDDEPGNPGGATVLEAKPKTKKPSMYKVLLLNDDYTPMELVVDVTPNDADGTCTLDASLVVTEVDGSNADADEFDLLVDSGAALEFIDLSESYVAVAGGLFDFEGSIVVEDGASGQVEAVFTDMDSNAPVAALLESAEWSCEACPEVTADLNGDGLVGAADLMVLLGVFGGTDPVADIDGDGSVGVNDLTTLLGQWGMVDCG